MPSADSKMNRSVARPAATTEKQPLAGRGSISLLFAQTAAMKQKSRSSLRPTDLFTAVTASQKPGKSRVGVNIMSQITKDTIIADILKIAPDSVPLFRSIGMNCLGCAMASGETLGQACAAHGVDVDDLLSKLTEFVEQ